MLNTNIDIPTSTGNITIEIKAGTSVVLVGANGSGKTRLGVSIDRRLSETGIDVHRIAAHRSISLNPDIIPPSLEIATKRLLYGYDQGDHNHKHGYRYQSKPETVLLNDFDHVLSALYAENNDISIAFRQNSRTNPAAVAKPPDAKIDKLKAIWENLLPHRKLVVLSGNVKTKTTDGREYSASDMSDGERVIFYLVAQCLIAKPNTLLIFDEPELHINKSILAKIWDEIESARSDCSFLYITHDVEFAASRHAAARYALRNYRKEPTEAWDIEIVPDDAEIPDDVLVAIIGSRRPVLFIEGDGGSLDASLYRRVYSEFTIIPVSSCDLVIHTVASFAARPELHRVGCAGIVDADGRTDAEAKHLEKTGIYRLPVSEVENILLLPNVFLALAGALKFEKSDAEIRLGNLKAFVLEQASKQIDAISLRHTTRQIDSAMKKIGLKATDIESLEQNFQSATASVNARMIFDDVKEKISRAVAQKNYELVLLYYDNKGLLSEVAKQLGYRQKDLEEFIGRALRSDDTSGLQLALTGYLPVVVARPLR